VYCIVHRIDRRFTADDVARFLDSWLARVEGQNTLEIERRLAHVKTPRLHIGVLVEKRYLEQLQPNGLITAVRERGHTVTVVDPDNALYEAAEGAFMDGFDLVVVRGRSLNVLCLVAVAETAGLWTVNSLSAIRGVLNKAQMGFKLTANRIPTPPTYFGTIQYLAGYVTSYPLVLKPVFGDNGRGLKVVQTAEELLQLGWEEPTVLAQQYILGDGYDLKLYAIGDEVWAVRKPSPLSDLQQEEAELVPISQELVDLGRRCGELFGLELYGVDCILTPDGPTVIEINEFPNYTAVPNANELLADYVIQRAREM
jgi:ribosomal protein S6--L-glutamate ligase